MTDLSVRAQPSVDQDLWGLPPPLLTPPHLTSPDLAPARRSPARRFVPRRALSLHDRFDPRRNHLSVIRLGLALIVAVSHAMQLGYGRQPAIAGISLGELAVDAFFVLSGYLLAGSYLRLSSIRRYVWHRFLRIMPGFWACLIITAFVVAPVIAWLQGRSPVSVFSGAQSSIDFVIHDSLLMMRQFGIAGLPENVHESGVLNGSLWTLFYEALCYAGVIGLGVIGALRWRPGLTLASVGLIWAAMALNMVGLPSLHQERLLRFLLMFLIGSVLFLYARVVPIRGWYALASVAVVVAALFTTSDYRVLGGPAFAYLCLWCVVVRPPRRMLQADFSYGLYAYHWPILQVLVVLGLPDLGVVPYLVLGLPLAVVVACLSWYLVEQPALRFKDARWVHPHQRRPRHRSAF